MLLWESTSTTTKKGLVQEAQEPGHQPKAIGEAIQVSKKTNQHCLQPGGAEEVVPESPQLVISVPFPDDLEDEASWSGGQNCCNCRDYNL